jgi:S1-C subfamily serine protease
MAWFDWVVICTCLIAISSLASRGWLLRIGGVSLVCLLALLVGGILYQVNIVSGPIASLGGQLLPVTLDDKVRPIALLPEFNPQVPLPVGNQESFPPSAQGAFESVVRVWAAGCENPSWGSAWVIRPGVAVTAGHVVAGSYVLRVEQEGNKWDSKVFSLNRQTDLALIQVPRHLPPLKTASKVPKQGWVIGYPDGGNRKEVPVGIGETQWLRLPDLDDQTVRRRVLVTRANVTGGMSGGPLVNKRGEVLGSLLFSLQIQGAGFGKLADIGTVESVGSGKCPRRP